MRHEEDKRGKGLTPASLKLLLVPSKGGHMQTEFLVSLLWCPVSNSLGGGIRATAVEVALSYSVWLSSSSGFPGGLRLYDSLGHSWRGPTSIPLLQLFQQLCKHHIAFIKPLPVYNL